MTYKLFEIPSKKVNQVPEEIQERFTKLSKQWTQDVEGDVIHSRNDQTSCISRDC